MPNAKCIFQKEDQTRCESYAIDNSEFCFSHDPNSTEKKRAATSKGGSKKRERDLELLEVKNLEDLQVLLADVMNNVRIGIMTPKEADSIEKLANVYLKMCGIS